MSKQLWARLSSGLQVGAVAGLAALGSVAGMPGTAEAQNRFVFANESEYDTLDPHTVWDVGRVAVRLNMYDGLMRWQKNPPVLEHWLAESHTLSTDGGTYTFKLRRNAKFHDGTPVTAKDVVYSMERVLALGKGAASQFKKIIAPGNAKAIDDYTVEFKLTTASQVFLWLTTEIHVVNSDLVKKNEVNNDWGQAWLSKNVAGTGAFKLKQFDPAVGFVAERFKDHFKGWGAKYLDEVEFRAVKEVNTRVLGTMKGDFHGAGGYMSTDQLNQMRKSGQVNILEEESMRIMLFFLHNQRAPLNDINVRRAINYAFDYDGFNQNILGGLVQRNPTPIPGNLWGAPKDVGYSYDIEKAKAELAKAQVKPDKPLEIVFLSGFSQSQQAAELLQNGLQKIGLQSKVVGNPWPTVVDKVQKPDTAPDIVVYWISAYYADPHNWIGEMYHSGQWGTFKAASFYKNAKVDELLDKAMKSTAQAERSKHYEEAARIVTNEAAGLWIYNTKWYGPYRKEVKGVSFSPIGSAQEMRTVYIEK